jgi:hypothetical protein
MAVVMKQMDPFHGIETCKFGSRRIPRGQGKATIRQRRKLFNQNQIWLQEGDKFKLKPNDYQYECV